MPSLNSFRIRLLVLSVFLASLAGENYASVDPTPYLYLKIYSHNSEDLADRWRGYASVDPGMPLPRALKDSWYVRVQGTLPLFTNEKLAGVIRQRQLRGLDLSAQSAFGDEDVAPFSELSSLRYLSLEGTRVTDAAMAHVAKLTQLEVLRLPAGITEAGLTKLTGLSRLRELSFEGAPVTDAGLTVLRGFRHLEHLDLRGTQVTDAGLTALQKLPLRVLTLPKGVTDNGLLALRSHKRLRQIDLSETQVTDAGTAHLRAFSSLHTLFASRFMTSRGLVELAYIRSLRRLDLTGTGVTDISLGVLGALEGLEELALSDTPVTDQAVTRLSRMRRLRVLEVSGTEITPEGWPEFAALKSLEIVSLSWHKGLQRSSLRRLVSLPKLRMLILNGNALSRARIEQIKDVISVPTTNPGSADESYNSREYRASAPGMRRLYLADAESDTEQETNLADIRFEVSSKIAPSFSKTYLATPNLL